MSHPNVPLLRISNEHWEVDCYDPRVHPERLGTRYVHGGWIAQARFDGQAVSGACDMDWRNFDGMGWPETFESGLGADIVVWASNLAASIEPKWARCVQVGESFTWSLRYRVGS